MGWWDQGVEGGGVKRWGYMGLRGGVHWVKGWGGNRGWGGEWVVESRGSRSQGVGVVSRRLRDRGGWVKGWVSGVKGWGYMSQGMRWLGQGVVGTRAGEVKGEVGSRGGRVGVVGSRGSGDQG